LGIPFVSLSLSTFLFFALNFIPNPLNDSLSPFEVVVTPSLTGLPPGTRALPLFEALPPSAHPSFFDSPPSAPLSAMSFAHPKHHPRRNMLFSKPWFLSPLLVARHVGRGRSRCFRFTSLPLLTLSVFYSLFRLPLVGNYSHGPASNRPALVPVRIVASFRFFPLSFTRLPQPLWLFFPIFASGLSGSPVLYSQEQQYLDLEIFPLL